MNPCDCVLIKFYLQKEDPTWPTREGLSFPAWRNQLISQTFYFYFWAAKGEMKVILYSFLDGSEHWFEVFEFFLVTWKPHLICTGSKKPSNSCHNTRYEKTFPKQSSKSLEGWVTYKQLPKNDSINSFYSWVWYEEKIAYDKHCIEKSGFCYFEN